MKNRLLPILVALVAVLATVALVPSAVPSAEASTTKHKTVYWIDLAGTASRHPHHVYFTANAGGYMVRVRWAKWGEQKTVGRGTFHTSAPCGGELPACPDGPATMVLRKPVRCTPEFGTKEGKTVLVYRHAKLTYPDGEGGVLHADITDRAGWASCAQAY